ncbi:MAG: hypothetical protein M3450_05175 [Actinomycetota bacterium]|nr:hypothetical protein [Actinomycetota bacterium]
MARVIFSAGVAAGELWAFGEDDLAQRALDLSEQQLLAAWRLAETYDSPDFPLPVYGRTITNGHVMAFAVMSVLEGDIRPLARERRRPKSHMPEAIRMAAASPGPSVMTVHRLYGDII